MNKPHKRSRKKPPEIDLFGEPVRPTPPLRKIVHRTEGPGFDIEVRQPGGTSYVRLNAFYSTRAEAGLALNDGVGLEPQESRETVRVVVYLSPKRRCQ